MRPLVDATQARLKLDEVQLRKVVVGLPSLTFSFGANIAPSLDALQERLGLSSEELGASCWGCRRCSASASPTASRPRRRAAGAPRAERRGASPARDGDATAAGPLVRGPRPQARLCAAMLVEQQPATRQRRRRLRRKRWGRRRRRWRRPTWTPSCALWCCARPSCLARHRCLAAPRAELWRRELEEEGLSLATEVRHRGLGFLCFSYERRTKPRLERARSAGLAASAVLPKLQLSDAKWAEWCTYKGMGATPSPRPSQKEQPEASEAPPAPTPATE